MAAHTWSESIEKCNRCRYRTFDMDGVYCTHPESFRIAPGFGASPNRMTAEGLCTGANDNPEKNQRQLFEERL